MTANQWNIEAKRSLAAGEIMEARYHLALANPSGSQRTEELSGLHVPLTKLLNKVAALLQNKGVTSDAALVLQLEAKYDFWVTYVLNSSKAAYQEKRVDSMGWWNGFFRELGGRAVEMVETGDDALDDLTKFLKLYGPWILGGIGIIFLLNVIGSAKAILK